MAPAGTFRLDLLSDPGMLPAVRDKLRHWAARLGWSEEQIAELVLAVDEALTNVIRHGYAGETSHQIHLRVRALDDPQRGPGLEVDIRDHGRQVDPRAIRGRDLRDLRPGGLGVHIIRSLMDSVRYSRARGGGMRVVMRKYRSAGPRSGEAGSGSDDGRGGPETRGPHHH